MNSGNRDQNQSQLDFLGKAYVFTVAVVSTVLSLVLPLSILVLFEKIIPNNSTDSLIAIFLIIVTAVSLDYFLRNSEARFVNKQASIAGRSLLSMLYKSFIFADRRKFKGQKYGVFLEEVRAIEQAKESLMTENIKIAATITSGVVVLAVITGIEPVTGLLLILGSLIYYGWALRFKPERSRTLINRSLAEGRANTAIIDIVTSPYKVKSSSMEFRAERYLSPIIDRRANEGLYYESLASAVNANGALFGQVCLFVIIIVASIRVINGDISQGVMAAIILLVNRYFSFLQQFINFDQMKSLNTEVTRSIQRIKGLARNQPSPIESNTDLEELTIEGLVCQRGKVMFIGGVSGSGKTTIQKMLTKETEQESSHSVLINGKATTFFDLDYSRRHVIRVTRTGRFINGTLIDNLTCFNPELHNLCYYLAEAFNVRSVIDKLPKGFYTEISRTQRLPFSKKTHYLLLLIRAVLCEKDVLLVDEVDQVLSQTEIEGLAQVLANQRRNSFTIISSKSTFEGDMYQTVTLGEN